MHDFDYDALQKKRLARNAKYKKNGSKSKKCTLPSDYLSRKEREKMNGEVKNFNLKKKYSWYEFTAMPSDIQKEYLERLRDIYGATMTEISVELFGVSQTTLADYSKNHGRRFAGIFPKGKRQRTDDQVNKWKEFVASNDEIAPQEAINRPTGTRKEKWFDSYTHEKKQEEKDTITAAKEEVPIVEPQKVYAAIAKEETPAIDPKKVKVSTCSISLSGPADVPSLCKSLYNILNAQSNGHQVISFRFKCEFSMEE